MIKIQGSQNQDAAQAFINLSREKEALVSKLKELNLKLNESMLALGLDTMLQDEEGTVYKISQPKGTYIEFKTIDYVRTRRGEEKSGDLSLKDAEAAGFEVERKNKKKEEQA